MAFPPKIATLQPFTLILALNLPQLPLKHHKRWLNDEKKNAQQG